MRRVLKSCYLVALWILCFQLSAQTPTKEYPDPEFDTKLFYYNQETNELTALQNGILITDSRTSGFTSQEEFYYTEGEKSVVRIKKGTKICFLMKWSNDHLNPNQYFFLMKMKYNPRKKRREVVTNQSSTYVNSNNEANVKIYYKTKKVKENIASYNKDVVESVLRMFIVENLEPGEYVWKHDRDAEALFFGVD